MDINYGGLLNISQAALPAMVERGEGGAIVNIASISGLRGSKDRAAYGASKGGVVTLTQTAMFNRIANRCGTGLLPPRRCSKLHSSATQSIRAEHCRERSRTNTSAKLISR